MDDDDQTPADPNLIDGLEHVFHLIPSPPDRMGKRGNDRTLARVVDIQLVEMKAKGMTYADIARETGYASASSARHAVLRALDRHETENVRQLRTLENVAYQADLAVIRAIIDNEALPPDVRLRAIDTRTRAAARHARLNGLDAPQQIAVTSMTQIELAQVQADFAETFPVVVGEVIEHDPDTETG